ncbi:signal transduction histidine kinase [Allocatelliglobosispora scoriae]|uniref:histidine kinase n=1 Tax=Allocatelliglobosispora scoriae TaxID=643052 RepID=A0A841BYR0_9ACTN|nr:histidine kinase [Allocatelliglobosispora scoriae]MBB5872706.1 signal transduction histidine kinase [Allocatelliglobosispora scoriae]
MRWRRVVDVGLVAWMLLAAILQVAFHFYVGEHWIDIDTLGYVLIVAFNLPLLVRRRAPAVTLLMVCVISTIYLALGYYHSVVTFQLALGIFSVAMYKRRRTSIWLSMIAFGVLAFAQHRLPLEPRLFGYAVVGLIAVIAWAYGDSTGRLADRGRQLSRLSEQLRREQQERAHRAVSQEQRRIARELHDVVAHHMSVISVQAGLGRYVLKTDPDTARAALEVIAGTAHEALSEMRRMLAVLRVAAEEPQSDTPYDSAPGLSRLPELLERVRSAGATVDIEVHGTEVPLPSGLGLCVYRVIQESLTNVLKHADPPVATVALRWQPHELAVTVTDRGAPLAEVAADAVGGDNGGVVRHGLIGMRERTRIYGGTLHAGERPGGGFQVALTLPLEERVT